MATGRMTLDELLSSLEIDGTQTHALDSTMKPTLAPRFRRARRSPPAPGPRTLPEPLPEDRSSHELKIRGPLAEGGMGKVLLAQQSGLRRDVAVKTLKDEFLEEAFAARLLREARALGLVEHPNIVPLYAMQTDERNAPMLVMKRIEGVPWRTLIHDSSHPAFPADAQDRLAWHLRVLMRVCDAVHYAHSRGVLHLDLKPDNVMIGAFREVYLVDWGVAVSTHAEHRGWLPMADEVHEIVGTPAYLAPEMVDVDRETLDARTDVYLLGAVLHEILIGRPPHRGDSLQELLFAAYQAEIPKMPDSVPNELAQIVQRAMEPEPSKRFRTAEALRAAVASFLEHRNTNGLVRGARKALDELRSLSEAEVEPVPIALRSDEANARVQRAFGRCRFGFAEALRQWPENEDASAGLSDALATMARYHLSRKEAASAEILLEELGDDPRVAPLRVESEKQRMEAARLEQLGHEESADPGRRERGRLMLGATLFVSVPVILGYIGQQMGMYRYEWWHTVVYTLLLTGFMGIGGFLARDALMSNRRGRQILASILAVALMAVTFRTVTVALGMRDLESLAFEMTYFGSAAVLAGILADRRFFIAAPGFFGATAGILMAPVHALLIVALGTLLGPGVLAWTWMRNPPDTPASDTSTP